MPSYRYEVLNEKSPKEIFEVEQKTSDPPLKRHPITDEPVRRMIMPASLSLKHSQTSENGILSDHNLAKNGFVKYEKADSEGNYERVNGKDGPKNLKS